MCDLFFGAKSFTRKNIFDIPDIEKWNDATTYLGINVGDMSGQSGLA